MFKVPNFNKKIPRTNSPCECTVAEHKRIRQIGVELIWCLSRIKLNGVVEDEEARLEAWCKELEEILISLGVSKESLHKDGFSPKGETLPREASRNPVEIDGEELYNNLLNNKVSLDVLHRPELIALCWRLGYEESDTRGKPVRKLREMVTTKTAETNSMRGDPVSVMKLSTFKKPILTAFKLPRRLT